MSLTAVAAVLLALGGCGFTSEDEGGGAGKTLRWYVFNEPSGAFEEAASKCTEQANGRYRVEIVPLPTDADQQRELVVRRLAAEDSDIDIIGMDVIWTAEFAEAGWIKEWTGEDRERATEGVIPALLASTRYEGRMWAAPLNTNTQLLWYRKDLVDSPPETWAEMLEQARELGDKGQIQVQGARYEGLTVWFNSLTESAGGQIVTPEGEVALGPPAVRAAEVMRNVANSPAAPPGLSNSKEDEGRLGFQEGNSAFMVNYTFVYPSAKGLVDEAKTPAEKKEAQANLDRLGWARYPAVEKGRPSKVTVGGINLGVGEYSKNPELAFEAAHCLRGPENQTVIAEKGGLPPTLSSLYETERIKQAFPFAALLRESLVDGVTRPQIPAYGDITLAVQDTLHPPRDIKPRKDIDVLRDRLEKVTEGGLF